jgi:hypothetical protein
MEKPAVVIWFKFYCALMALISFAASASAQGTVLVACAQDDQNWLSMTFTGSAYAGSLAPTAALLDEARQFMAELSTGFISDGKREKLIGIILAKVVIEHFGGTLEAGSVDNPGFLARFPTAA